MLPESIGRSGTGGWTKHHNVLPIRTSPVSERQDTSPPHPIIPLNTQKEDKLVDILATAFDGIPNDEKRAYLEATIRVPTLVSTESDPWRVLLFSGGDAVATARKLACYWRERKELFGDRAFLPMDLSAEGALNPRDVALYQTGVFVRLPEDTRGCAAVWINRDRLHAVPYEEEDLKRILFYVLGTISLIEDRRDHLNVLGILRQRDGTRDTHFFSNVAAYIINSTSWMPFHLETIHAVSESPHRGVTDIFLKTFLPRFQALMGDALQEKIVFHTYQAGQEKVVATQLKLHGFTLDGIPTELGGRYAFNENVSPTVLCRDVSKDVSSKSGRFQETEFNLEAALSKLEDAIEVLPEDEKAALLEARRIRPDLYEKESEPRRFLRVEDFNTWSAAKRLALYWSKRKLVFQERWLLPMNQTGEGALTLEDTALLSSGYVVIIPPDQEGHPVVFFDASRRSSDGRIPRLRVGFYMFQVLSESQVSQSDGLVSLTVHKTPTLDSTCRELFSMLCTCLPFRVHSVHIVNSPGDDGNFFIKNLAPILLKMLEKAFGSKTRLHVGAHKDELVEKLSHFGFQREHLPLSVGGNWSYEKFAQWQEFRTRLEWDLPASSSAKRAVGVLDYKVTKFADLTEADRIERKRRMNVLHSRRKRQRSRIETETLKERATDLRERNATLAAENERLQRLLLNAQRIVSESLRDPPPVVSSRSARPGLYEEYLASLSYHRSR